MGFSLYACCLVLSLLVWKLRDKKAILLIYHLYIMLKYVIPATVWLSVQDVSCSLLPMMNWRSIREWMDGLLQGDFTAYFK